MGDGLGEGEAPDRLGDAAAEEHLEAVGRGAGLGEEGLETVEALLLMAGEVGEADVEAEEGLAVAGQREVAGVGQRREAAAGGEPVADRVGLGLGGVDADVRGDAGEDLVAGEDEVVADAPERRLLRRVAVADLDAPAPAAGLDLLALDDAAVAEGKRVDRVGEVVGPGFGALRPACRRASRRRARRRASRASGGPGRRGSASARGARRCGWSRARRRGTGTSRRGRCGRGGGG